MSMRFFVYPAPGGPALVNFDTLAEAIVRAPDPELGAIIVHAPRAEPSGPAESDVPMATCKNPGAWTLTDDGEEEPGTAKLVRAGLAQVEEAPPIASEAADAT